MYKAQNSNWLHSKCILVLYTLYWLMWSIDDVSTARQAWNFEMDATRAAARCEDCDVNADLLDESFLSSPAPVDSEGSIYASVVARSLV